MAVAVGFAGPIWRSFLICFVFLSTTVLCQNGPQFTDRSKILSLLLDSEQDTRSPPNYDSNDAIEIECDLNVNSVDSINEANMDFTVRIIINLQWHDKRLGRFQDFKFDVLEFDAQNMEKVWVPDIYFPNEKEAMFHKIMKSNRVLRVNKFGIVNYSARVSVTLSCLMDLRKYPFDKQTCSVLMESFAFTADKLKLIWTPDNETVTTNSIRELPQFKLQGPFRNAFIRENIITGNHSCLQADFHLVRNIGYYVIQMYIPSLLIVMLSWVSFWLNANSVPGRVSLGVLSVLTISTQSSGVNASLPRVSYTKAIDVWMAVCLVFVFAALLEFAVVNVISRKVPGRRFSLARLFMVPNGQDEASAAKDTTVDQEGRVTTSDNRSLPKSKIVMWSMYLDVASRYLFPLSFAIFNLIYWLYYLNVGIY